MAHSSLASSWKLQRVAEILKISLPTAVGHLNFLWWAVYESTVDLDGKLHGWSPKKIARVARYDGPHQSFVDALVDVELLDKHDDCFSIHDYAQWAPDYVKKRCARRDSLAAGGKRQPVDADGGQQQSPDADGRLPDPTQLNVTRPDPSKPHIQIIGAATGDENLARSLFSESERATVDREKRFRQALILKVCLAFGWQSEKARQQKRALSAVAGRIYLYFQNPERQKMADWVVELAGDKARCAGLDSPVMAWQAEVDQVIPLAEERLGRKIG